MFNPFKYRYQAHLISEEGDDAILQIQNGQLHQNVRVPKSLLPKELAPGQKFTLTFQPEESAKKDEYESLKMLLQDLIT
jgi:hypothetical protein